MTTVNSNGEERSRLSTHVASYDEGENILWGIVLRVHFTGDDMCY